MKKYLYLFIILTACLMIGCSPKPVLSENIVFIIDSISGDVSVSTDEGKTWKKAEAGFVLRETYQIRTGSGSFCDIIMPDRGIFRVADNSIVYLSKLKKQMEDIRVRKGKIFAHVTKKLLPDERFQVETETAVVSVRGTEFVVDTDGDKTVTTVKEGEVKVRKNITLETGKLDPNVAEQLTEISVKQNENFAVDSKGNRAAEKELNNRLKDASDADAARKILVESAKTAAKEVRKTENPEAIDKEFREINQPEKLKKIDEEAERIRKEKEEARDKKALEDSVNQIKQKTGQKGIAGKKVSEEITTAEEDQQAGVADKKADEIREKLKDKKGQNGSPAKDLDGGKKKSLRERLKKAKERLKNE